jgi:hypothetical protein
LEQFFHETFLVTLKLLFFDRVIPEYSRSLEESDILENAFQASILKSISTDNF